MDQGGTIAAAGAPPEPSAPAGELIAGVARALEGRFDAVTAALMGALDAQMPEIAGDEDFRDQTYATARASAELITAMALTWADPQELQAPREALEWARRGADRGITGETLLRAYRLGHARYWDLWYDELREQQTDPDVFAEATAASSAFFFRWIDAISAPLLRAHEEQRDRRVRSAEAVRSDTARRILEGAPVDEQAAAARLSYELGGWHLGLIAWVDAEGADPEGTALEDVTTQLARTLAGPAAKPLLVRDGALELWGWVRRFEPFDEDALAQAVTGGDPRVRVALGRPGLGIEGFRDSHLQARVARRVARFAAGGEALVRYDDESGVLALLTNDADRARRFVRRTLGPLAAEDEGTRRLLDTLRVFQEEGQSFARTAARLGVHQNTAAYRVKRALELAGKEDASSLALRAAVALVPLVGRDGG